MKDILLGIIILTIIAFALMYIVKAKKSGVKCIGCPAAKNCSSKYGDNTIDLNNCKCGCKNDYSYK